MKKLLLLLFAVVLFSNVKAQIFSPNLIGQQGVFVIYYPYGYYQGNVYNGYANGLGTFYWTDGTIFNGYFYNGVRNGQGIIVTRYGYLSGCWGNGNYMGACQAPPMYNQNSVPSIVRNVQNNRPTQSSTNYPAISPTNYTVTEIDPSTEMGASVLAGYR